MTSNEPRSTRYERHSGHFALQTLPETFIGIRFEVVREEQSDGCSLIEGFRGLVRFRKRQDQFAELFRESLTVNPAPPSPEDPDEPLGPRPEFFSSRPAHAMPGTGLREHLQHTCVCEAGNDLET